RLSIADDKSLQSTALGLMVTGCATLSDQPGPGGKLTGKLDVEWISPNQFIYTPNPSDPLTFVSTDGRRIVPQRMFTDGGSIPPVLWGVPGFSPWGYGPAYIVHDWLFTQHHCRLPGYETVFFDDSARILGEVIDTLMNTGEVPRDPEARVLISAAVRT